MFSSSYTSEQQVRQELAKRREQAAAARRARSADRAAYTPARVRVRQLVQWLAVLISGTSS